MPAIVLDARRNPATVYENADVALARQYMLQTQALAGQGVEDVSAEVAKAEAWVQSPTAPDPLDPLSKSAKTISAEMQATLNGLVIRPGGVSIGGASPLATVGAHDLSGNFRSWFALMPDGSIYSTAFENLVTSRIGGTEVFLTNVAGYQFAIAKMDEKGRARLQAGLTDDGEWYPSSGGGSATYTLKHTILAGSQSNGEGFESVPKITAAVTGWGSRKFFRGVQVWKSADNAQTPAAIPAEQFVSVDLTAEVYETRANGFADHYKARLVGAGRYSARKADGDVVLWSASALGGQYFTELGPIDDRASGRSGSRSPGGLWPTALNLIDRGLAEATRLGMRYEIPFWICDQGENEGAKALYYNNPLVVGTVADTKAGYATEISAAVIAFDAAVRTKTGKAAPTPCLISPPCSNVFIPTVWLDLADSSDLAIMIGPRYAMPSALRSTPAGGRIHYSADGQRWVGEMGGKVGSRIDIEGERWQPLRILRCEKLDANTVRAWLNVPRGNIVFDTATWPKLRGWGFRTWSGTLDAQTYSSYADALTPYGATAIDIHFPTALPAGARLEVGNVKSYADHTAHTITAVGSTTYGGQSAYTITIAGDRTLDIGRMLVLDAIDAIKDAPGQKTGVIRAVALTGGNTVLTGLVSECLDSANAPVSFIVGDTIHLDRIKLATNIRDSDPAASVFSFSSQIPAMEGKPYPLWNWLCQHDGLVIEGA